MFISTIGYEGSDIDHFLATLEVAGIDHLIDVRAVPVSRKKGFSKNRLAEALREVGIQYTHLQALGDPKEGREAMKRGDYSSFLEIFTRHLQRAEVIDAIEKAIELALQDNVALMCYERDPKECHRTIVAQKMGIRTSKKIRSLGVLSSQAIKNMRLPDCEVTKTAVYATA
ncbi:MAG: DUF488 domain-containing protein [Sphingomonadaceae bacterium]|nr:DUF488 domain-containing protein [Sphingomonadaceae bacterium]